MQGGQIFVETEPGVGSTFSFTLPTTPQVEIPEDAAARLESGESRRILVVDDEPDIADLLRMYLERSGYQVLIAYSAAEAFDLAQTELPDLITLDVLLPDANGFTVLEWLKSDDRTRNIPVVLISILPDDGHGELLGAVEYLTKPVTEDDLLMYLERSLGDDRAHLILVAEDDDDIRNLLVRQLAQAGYRVVEAVNGEEAVAVAKAKKPALALLDIKMPVMDGITALRVLRSDRETQNLSVVTMTASPGLMEASQSAAQTLGVAALLRKPFTPEDLAAAIDQGLTDGQTG